MPPVSQKMRGAMGAAASGHSTLGIPQSVGQEFINADPGGPLPERVQHGKPVAKKGKRKLALKKKKAAPRVSTLPPMSGVDDGGAY